MACGVVNDREIREAFSKILWVSIGQEPDVRELLASMLQQMNEQELKPDLSDKEALVEVKKAAKGLKALLVLDYVVSVASSLFFMCTKPCSLLTHNPPSPVGHKGRATTERD